MTLKKKELLKVDNNKISYAFLAALLTAPCVFLIYFFAGRLNGNGEIFLYSDLRVQYIAFAKMFWRSLLSGDGIWYTFHLSLGMPSISLYTFYSLSPFNILYLLIDHAELASVFLVICKLSVSAYAFQRFSAKVLKNDSFSSVIFAVGYALNGYSLIYYYNILYLDGIYMLPIIAILIVEAVKEKRFVKLTLAYTYLFLVQFYTGYIIGFFSLLFFILMMITEYKKDWKQYVRALVNLGISVLIAALIGAMFLYPTAVFLIENRSINDISAWPFNCNILDIYKNIFLGQYQTIDSPYPYIYCGIMTLYLVPCFFADRRVKKEHKIIAFVLLGYLIICSLWFPAYQFMHCFDLPDGFGFRFAYFYPFVLLAIGCMEFKYMESKRIWKLVLLFLLCLISYFIVNIGGDNITAADRICNVVFLAVFLFLFIAFKKYGDKRLYQGLVLGIVCVDFIINGVFVMNKVELHYLLNRDIYQAFTTVNRRAVDEIKAGDHGFYRIVQENPYDPNDSAMNDYYGIVYFSTMEDVRQRETLGLLGYGQASRGVHDNGGTPLTRMLFSQKYEILANSADYAYGRSDELWSVNDRTLSLGFMASDEILRTTLDSDIAFENLNKAAGDLIGQDIQIFIPYSGEITGTMENMSVLWDGERYFMEPNPGMTEGSLVFRMEDDVSMPAYAYFTQEESFYFIESFTFMSEETDRIRIRGTAVISLPQIIELVKDDEGKYFVGIYFNEFRYMNNFYKDSYFYCYDEEAFDSVYDALKNNQMNVIEMKESDITAEIEVSPDKTVLFTSIPYDEGWHVYVDGMETETLAALNDTFLAVRLSEGHHELRFVYKSKLYRTGVFLSIVGIILYLGLILAEKKIIVKTRENI